MKSVQRPVMTVTVGGIQIQTPVYTDETTTRDIINRVNARLAEIEQASPRIDTRANVLQTAISFAAEAEQLRSRQDLDNLELLDSLNDILTTLRKLIKSARK